MPALSTPTGLKGWLRGPSRPGEKPKSPSAFDKRRIAVLPFLNMSPDPADDYFADGMMEELIATISKMREVSVVSRTSVMQYRKNPKAAKDVAEELQTGSILEGSVRKAGNKVRVTVQLVDAAEDKHVWTESYDRGLEDVFAIQSDISRNVADALKIQLLDSERQRLESLPTKSMEAYMLYLKGRGFMNERSHENLLKAIRHFEEAVKRDPKYAAAYAGLSDCYGLMESWSNMRPQRAWPKAMESATKALELDESLAEAHTSMAMCLAFQKWDWKGAENEFRRSLQLNPSYATAHHWYAYTVLKIQRKWKDAIEEMQRAVRLDPFSSIIGTNFGEILFYSGRVDEALQQFRKVLARQADFSKASWELGTALVYKSLVDEGTAEIEKSLDLVPDYAYPKAALAYAYMAGGKREDAERVVQELREAAQERYVAATIMAEAHAVLGEKDSAFEWLNRAVNENSSSILELNSPLLDSLRTDERYQDILRKIGLN
jgi:TolB-like protein/Tfp pilus assembly protein PilF